jgi:hypothetical protein
MSHLQSMDRGYSGSGKSVIGMKLIRLRVDGDLLVHAFT